ncbi:hypothetical protein [Ottowia sp.]|uniref:hypothetical protein n=1 Tax=Ottowia sp. TaxID=1898956 RepID=UPI002C1908C4|nr:hypothetical protein [Ottowia sp.]HOB68027.1 hypothetical protein [Ottowia sp.]HPZ58718.1 hypothetical protein [Ottowia sp.]HQD49375.1 hypothetical protein [Ottowia sp.]
MTAAPATTVLKPDESLCRTFAPRTQITVLSGAVVLEGPMRWLAETPWCPRIVLHAGQSHRVASTGWVRLRAMRGAEAVIGTVEPPDVLARLWLWCRGRKKARSVAGWP